MVMAATRAMEMVEVVNETIFADFGFLLEGFGEEVK
jgi:hypothetical protein